MNERWGVVVFGDVVGSRRGPSASTGWLDTLCRRLDDTYGLQRMASFEYTQGDEIQGLLHPDVDPFRAVLAAGLQAHAGKEAVPAMRWVAVLGTVNAGQGPATHRTGPAFTSARALVGRARDDRDGLLCRTGDATADAYLAGTTPLLAAIIDRMTDRQRHIARLALIDGLRQSEIAARLDVSRPTVSVSAARADVRNLSRLVEAVRQMWVDGVGRVLAGAIGAPGTDVPA
jgi:DNA-binding CsgD family transcriptional regulator